MRSFLTRKSDLRIKIRKFDFSHDDHAFQKLISIARTAMELTSFNLKQALFILSMNMENIQ